jgi:hypothetical protein
MVSAVVRIENYISISSLLIMAVTTLLFYYYTRIGRRIRDPITCPPLPKISKLIWATVWIGSFGISLSIILLLSSAFRLLFALLANPQTGIMVAQPVGTSNVASISALDVIGLTVLLIMHAAELVVLGLTLFLLFLLPTRGVR